MVRKIIKIDEEKCNGCVFVPVHATEGAIDIVNGKAKLVRENFCDGFGDCLPGCPMGAISFEEREAPAYDEVRVKEAQEKKGMVKDMHQCENKMMNEMEQHAGHGCPGSKFMTLKRSNQEDNDQSGHDFKNELTSLKTDAVALP